MNFREMNLAVFQRKPVPHVFFQPRFEPYVAWQRRFGRLPAEVAGLDLPAIYDHVGASMRTVHYYTGQPDPIERSWAPEVKVSHRRQGDLERTRYDTPHGPLFATSKWTVDETWRTVEWPAKTADDLPALRWLLQRQVIRFNGEKYRVGKAYIGERGEGHFWVPKSPYFALAQMWFSHADFIYAMADHPAEMADLMRIVDDSYDGLYQQLCASRDVRILNFGENVAMAWLSPRYYQQHVEPWYHKRAGQLRRAGIFTHVHIDGHFHPLLPYLKDMPFDGLEALTPTPQGDVTLEEIKEHIGEKILVDGIPAVLFLEHHPFEQLQQCVQRVVELFHPRLVLGISDELPEGGGPEAFRRLKWVAGWCRTRT
ncbi:MAG: hypothetical protein AMJ81_11960 [Phycisphaerae bacterium SM23_33]|nr:MAG: hypothetical protein AMJ81_11960 [Phycisphaerae bacterium SM23_33]